MTSGNAPDCNIHTQTPMKPQRGEETMFSCWNEGLLWLWELFLWYEPCICVVLFFCGNTGKVRLSVSHPWADAMTRMTRRSPLLGGKMTASHRIVLRNGPKRSVVQIGLYRTDEVVATVSDSDQGLLFPEPVVVKPSMHCSVCSHHSPCVHVQAWALFTPQNNQGFCILTSIHSDIQDDNVPHVFFFQFPFLSAQ